MTGRHIPVRWQIPPVDTALPKLILAMHPIEKVNVHLFEDVDDVDRYPILDQEITIAFVPVEVANRYHLAGGGNTLILAMIGRKLVVPNADASVLTFAMKSHVPPTRFDIKSAVAEADQPGALMKVLILFQRVRRANSNSSMLWEVPIPVGPIQ